MILTKKEKEYWINFFKNNQGQNYPCSNQIVICGIITDKDKAISFMNKSNYKKIRIGRSQIVWLPQINENTRGYHFYKIIIDKNIDKNIFYTRILPYCNLYCIEMKFI